MTVTILTYNLFISFSIKIKNNMTQVSLLVRAVKTSTIPL